MKIKAFSLVELLISLIVISLLLVAFMPVLSKKSKKPAVTVQNMDSVPVGSVIYWLGKNYPEGWIPIEGQDITGDEYIQLRDAIGDGRTNLPDYSVFYKLKLEMPNLIIKYKKTEPLY